MTAPLVSILVPSYNQGKYIRETLESIFGHDYRPLEVIDGKMVIEVRRAGVSKAIAARHAAAAGVDPALIVAFGDDHTDEELFAALPRQSLTVAVGDDIAVADHRLVDVADVRRVLACLATAQLATDVVAGPG